MIIFEYVIFEIFKLLVTKWAAMMPINCFLNTRLAIHMATSCYVTIINWIETYCTLKLSLQFLWIDFEVNMVLVLFTYHCCISVLKN